MNNTISKKPIILKSKNDAIYNKYIICTKAGIKKYICYNYIEALEYIHNESIHKRIYNGKPYNQGMYILGIPYICKCMADYDCIYTHDCI